MKEQTTQTPILALPNFQETFMVEIGISNMGIGVVLTQDGHPLAYFCKKLTRKLSL